MDILALGELLIDFTVVGPPQESLRSIQGSAGGAPANVLAMASRLGMSTQFIGKVGRDAFGDFLQASLQDASIDIRSLLRDAAQTTLAFVTVDEQGERHFSFSRNPGADTCLQISDLDKSWFEDLKVFHYGSLSLTNEPSQTATWAAVAHARNNGCIISFDPNLRRPLWSDLNEAKRRMLEGVEQSHVVKLSDEEVEFVSGSTNSHSGVKRLLDINPAALILVTMGARGTMCYHKSMEVHVPSMQVQAVDTTAAGDAFMGAFLSQIIEGGTHISDIKMPDLAKMVRFSNVAGALTATKRGAIAALPSKEEIWNSLQQI